MKITILTVGSRGDVQPFLALGVKLRSIGHDVTLCTAKTFESWITGYGLAYAPMSDDLLNLKDTKAGKDAMGGKASFGLIGQVKPMLRKMLDDCWNAAQGADLLIYHPKTMAGAHIAEAMNIPGFVSIPLPLLTPTTEFPNPVFPPTLNLGGGFNRFTYHLMRRTTVPFIGMINEWRKTTLGLKPRSWRTTEYMQPDGSPVPALYSFSPSVVPAPHDWPESAVVTGYWFLDQPTDWTPFADLVKFLDAGAQPVYIGFGSMVDNKSKEKGQIILEGVKQSGQRAIIAGGWGGIEGIQSDENIMVINEAPHDWLLPKVSAVVHHGGAGTTAAGLRAGKPAIICPFIVDQPFWGHRVHALGAGPKPIPQKSLTAEALAAAICEAVQTPSIRARAEQLGNAIRSEDGLSRAVEAINRFAHSA
jgi:sterol 3beta-glucosyltransferase